MQLKLRLCYPVFVFLNLKLSCPPLLCSRDVHTVRFSRKQSLHVIYQQGVEDMITARSFVNPRVIKFNYLYF